jgi:hypothetical protein
MTLLRPVYYGAIISIPSSMLHIPLKRLAMQNSYKDGAVLTHFYNTTSGTDIRVKSVFVYFLSEQGAGQYDKTRLNDQGHRN